MAVKSTDIRATGGAPQPIDMDVAEFGWRDINGKKVVAAFVWAIGVFFTTQLPAEAAPLWLAALAAIVFQAFLSYLQSPIWRPWRWDDGNRTWVRRQRTALNWFALGVDAVINAVGCAPFVLQAHTYGFFQDFAAIFGNTTQPLVGVTAFGIALAIGAAVCAGPERLFFDDEYVA